MRLGKVVAAAVPFLLIDFLLIHAMRNGVIQHLGALLLFTLAALVAAGMAARAGASWKENCLGFACALVPFVDQDGTAILLLLFVAPGLFLAPALSGPVRAEPDVSLPVERVLGVALAALLGAAILMGPAGDPDSVLVYVTFMAGCAQLFGALVALVLSITGNYRAGAWVGGITGAAFLMAFAAVLARMG